jgi:2-dehydro-3-deoxygluconokinase
MLRFSPSEGDTLESALTYRVDIGGAESNVAVALARLGFRTGWISRLPDNALGRRLLGQIRHHGVDTSAVILAPDGRVGTYYIEPGRLPRATSVIYDRAHSAFSQIDPDQVDWDYVGKAKWLHLTGITAALGDGPRRTVERAIAEATRHGVLISFDVNYRARLWTPADAAATLSLLLRHIPIIQCSLRDAVSLFGTPASGDEAARDLYDRFHPRVILITDGQAGAVAYDGELHRARSIPAETLDPVGSGDAFAAGFIAGYKEGGIEHGLSWGVAAAAVKRTFRGDLFLAGRTELRDALEGAAQHIAR